MDTFFSSIVERRGTIESGSRTFIWYIYQNGIFWMNAVAWVHFMREWSLVKVYFGMVGVGGHFHGWLGMVGVGGGIFWVGGGECTIFIGR